MIAAHRRRHYWIFALLALLLPLLLVLAVEARPEVPRAEGLPAGVASFPDDSR